jgi:hypothetical protein
MVVVSILNQICHIDIFYLIDLYQVCSKVVEQCKHFRAANLGIVSFPFDVFFPLVVHVETRGGTVSLAFPLSFAASRGGMMSEMNAVVGACVCLMIYVEKKDMWLHVCARDGFGCMHVLMIELAACMYW